MPSFELNEEFDSGLGGYTVVGHAVLETVAPIQTSNSLRCNGTGTGYIRRSIIAGQTVEVASFYYRHDADAAGGAATIYCVDTAAGKTFQIRENLGVLQAIVGGGGVAVAGPSLVVGTTYLIDVLFDCSASTFTIDWKVDGSAKTQATWANGAPSTFTFERIGQVNGAPTYNFVVDSVRINRTEADYPFGAPGPLPFGFAMPRIESTASLKAVRPRHAGLFVDLPRIASTSHPARPSFAPALPPPPQDGYTGPRGYMIRTQSEDISATWAAQAANADIVRCWIQWDNLQPSHGVFDWGGIITSLRYCIDNNKKTAISISFGVDSPAWCYLANPTGAVAKIRVYTGVGDATGAFIPVPWDANLRKHWQNVMAALETLLTTSYNGQTYADVVAFTTVSMAMTVGTEMTIGDAGDSRNANAWNALSPVVTRRILYTQAWKNALTDMKTLAPSTRPFIATGTIWGDGRVGVQQIADYAAATWPASRGDILMGPTDMRVDKPQARSYDDWSHAAGQSLLYIASKHLTPWAQTAGDSWFQGGAFNIPTDQAVKKAWLDNAVNIYRCAVMEGNTSIPNTWHLTSWINATLRPALYALALPTVLSVGRIASTSSVMGPRQVRRNTPPNFLSPGIPSAAVVKAPTIALVAHTAVEPEGAAVYFSSVYDQTAVSSPG